MIFEYLLRLLLLIPIVGGLAWSSLWLWKKLQLGMPGVARSDGLARIVETLPLGGGVKLAVVEFGGKQHLLAISRTQVCTIASDDRGDFHAG
jgi:flagellar protein FliO/FliZ